MTSSLDRSPYIAVTHTANADAVLIEQAKSIALELNCPLLDRHSKTIQSLLEQFYLDALVVVEQYELTIHTLQGLLRHHPNTSVLRITNLCRGRSDVLIDLMQLKNGDRLLDCTCGLGSDAITGAYITGDEGYVLALESSPLLALLARKGMESYQHQSHIEVTQAMRRVNVKNACYQDVLRELPDKSFDVVYFDPMFKNSIEKANGIQLVRLSANYDTPTDEDIRHAKRIASRSVLLKDSSNGKLLNQLNFNLVKTARHFSYGRIRCSGLERL
ncbi:MAG: class I SAM-dependent methyltransferase [Candidatus Latescibacterota bacterium]|nr:class I SAM-dependent methyltransferase [Candidatus Latescibacterota bacterium]